MIIASQDNQLRISTPAKLNLFLEILGKREDGFHELVTVMDPVNIYDTLLVSRRDDPQILFSQSLLNQQSIQVEDETSSPNDDSNLVVKAFKQLQKSPEYLSQDLNLGADVTLLKNIPVAAGLAGGSSDAAAALVAANLIWDLKIPNHQLEKYAAELGSDVPFFLANQAAICTGRGEKIEPLAAKGPRHYVIVRPPVGLSTAEVFQHCEIVEEVHDVEPLLNGLNAGNTIQIGKRLFNRLESAAEKLTDWISILRQRFERMDVLGHQLTGTGTCYFALCRNFKHALHTAGKLRSIGVERVFVATSCC